MKVYFLSLLKDTPKRGYWDMAMLEDLLSDFDKEEVNSLPEADFGIVVIPARSHYQLVDKINEELSKIDNVLLFCLGDEEHVFPVEKIQHPNIKIYVQNPQQGRHDRYGKLPTGYTPAINNYKKEAKIPEKTVNCFFSGQITHSRRREMATAIQGIESVYFNGTDGFTKGLPQQEYYERMATAKTAPCPSGPEIVDSFRVWEALELGCVPIVDGKTPRESQKGFWEWLFGEPVPFPIIDEWEQLPGYTEDMVKQYPAINNRVQASYLRYKNDLKKAIYMDIVALGGEVPKQNITVVIPISYIPSHPGTQILEETIKSVRYHLPDAELLLTFDGIRPEQESHRGEYEEFIRRALWLANTQWGNVYPVIFGKHSHQSGMIRVSLDIIDTPLLLYVEQDTPLVTDEPIEWDMLNNAILSGKSNVIRLYHEGIIPEEHNQFMLDEPKDGLLKTVQWSQRPHLASTSFYRRLVTYFSINAKCYLEDLLHGKLMEEYKRDGMQGWNQWRVHLYWTGIKNLKRSYHTDGRAGNPKFDDKQVF